MKTFFRFLFELLTVDPWRKLGAIGLAFFLWLYVHQRITGEREYTLEIRPTFLKTWESESGFLYVRVSKERALQIVPELKVIQVTLKGPNKELASLPDQLIAYLDPGEGSPELKTERVQVALEKIRWDPPHVASLAKRFLPDPLALTFEAIEKAEIPLQQEQLEIQGTAPDGFEVYREQTEFIPSSVVVTGPHRSIEKLRNKGYRSLFRPLQIRKEDTRSVQSFALELQKELSDDGLALASKGAPHAFVPVRPKLSSLPFKARIYPFPTGEKTKYLQETYRLQGSTETHEWVEEDWIAEIPGTLGSEIREAWIEKNVRFLVDLGMITEGPEEITSFSLEVFPLLLVPAQDRDRYKGISFHPVVPGKAKITVEKRPPSPPK